MITGVNIIRGKTSIASVNGAGGGGAWGRCEPLSGGFRGRSTLRKFTDFKEHLDWFKTDLNATEIIVVQDYKLAKN